MAGARFKIECFTAAPDVRSQVVCGMVGRSDGKGGKGAKGAKGGKDGGAPGGKGRPTPTRKQAQDQRAGGRTTRPKSSGKKRR